MYSCSYPDSETSSVSSSRRERKRKPIGGCSSLNKLPSQSIQQGAITRTDIYHAFHEVMTQNFGIASVSSMEVQVCFYDPEFRLAVIKTTRDKCSIVRSSLTFLTQIKKGGTAIKVVASTVAVSGSARTARDAAQKNLKCRFFEQDLESHDNVQQEQWTKKKKVAMETRMNSQDLEDRLDKINSSCA